MMMTKQEHIDFWKNNALRDWDSVQVLFAGKQYMQALFLSYSVIEKLLKALWIKDNEENTPPFSHNLEYLYNQTDLELDNNLSDLFPVINNWNMEGRYQDYKDKFYKKCTYEYTNEKIGEVQLLKQWILENL